MSIPGNARMPAPAPLIEWPTMAVAIAIYAGFLLLTWYFTRLPLTVAAPLGALLLAWHGSLQHETIHNHPTPSRRFNALLGSPPLALFTPYPLYREIHLRHHRYGGRHLTHPRLDTESYYLPVGALASMGPCRRALHLTHHTLAGRLLLGPLLSVCVLWRDEWRELRAGNRAHALICLRHAFAVVIVFTWTMGICHIPLPIYVALVAYPSLSLTKLRSFIEHRSHPNAGVRTAVVETNGLWSLIFLNNNLHMAHHAQPRLPWYELPRVWRAMRDTPAVANARAAGMVFEGGYLQVTREFLFFPAIAPEHPGT